MVCQEACALRVPMNGHKKAENLLVSEKEIDEEEKDKPRMSFEQHIRQFVNELHPILHKAVEMHTEQEAINEKGKVEKVSIYPYGCIVGSAASRYLLLKIYNNRLKIEAVRVTHPKQKRLMQGRHLALIIIDNITGKKYFLSFFEGIWDDSHNFPRARTLTFKYPFKHTAERATLEYIDWFKKKKFPPVFFEFKKNKDILNLTELTVDGSLGPEFNMLEIRPAIDYIEENMQIGKWGWNSFSVEYLRKIYQFN